MINALLLVVGLVLAVIAYRRRRVGLSIWVILFAGLYLFTGKTAFLVLGTILVSLLLGQPLFVLMGALGVLLIASVLGQGSLSELTVVVRKLLELTNKEVLLAIPFFVVAGEVMTQGSLARRLIDVMRAAFGWIPGGLAVAAVAGCVFFAAISGSSPVTVVAIGSIMVPALIKAKYPEDFSIGLLTSAGSLGILIPPSIPMIVYAIMVSSTTPVDPIELFIAGVGPGLFIGALLAIYAVYTGIRLKLPTDKFSLPRLMGEMKRGFWSLLLPLIILGGIYSGVFTATEAAAVSVVYALAVEILIHHEVDRKKLLVVAENSMTVMGALLVIIALAITINYVLVDQEVPDQLVALLKDLKLERTGFLVLVNLLLLVVGCFMDIMSAILILAPMLAPMASAMGVNPIHMGIIFIVNLEIGYLTPPVGLNLFVSSTLFKKSITFVIRAVLPTLAVMMVSLVIVTWWPGLSLTLVEALRDKPKPAAIVAPPAPDAPPAPAVEDAGVGAGQVKSLAQMMAERRAAAAADAGELAPPAPEPKEKSLGEMMREAKERRALEAADSGVP